jgi:hypothetical protein
MDTAANTQQNCNNLIKLVYLLVETEKYNE